MCKHITNIFEEMNITTPMEVEKYYYRTNWCEKNYWS